MDLQAEVDKEQDVLQRITAVARRWPCGPFADLLWDELDFDVALSNNPGVIFESPIRAVVFQYVRGELRYYAGGWSPDPRHDPKGFFADQERKYAEGYEIGVFPMVRDALDFAEQYLVAERDFQDIQTGRQVFSRCEATRWKEPDGRGYGAVRG